MGWVVREGPGMLEGYEWIGRRGRKATTHYNYDICYIKGWELPKMQKYIPDIPPP